MSTTTSNLGLFKYNVETDSHLAFNINTALNENWDKIDEFAASSGGKGASRNLGEIISSTIPLTDAGLHLLDGALINGSGIYSEFVDYMAGLVTDYPDLFCTEAQWQQSITNYEVCGKFVYNSVNNTVRLPKITGFIEGTTDVNALGDLVKAGLPNITGHTAGADAYPSSGAFYDVAGLFTGSTYSGYGTVLSSNFDASRSSSIYGNSSTVQPQAIKVLYYIVIATTTKTDIQVDIDEIATDLNGKADIDLNNINPTTEAADTILNAISTTTKNNIVSWGMPDYSAGVQKSYPFTAEYDGIANVYGAGSGADTVLINGNGNLGLVFSGTNGISCFLHKGDILNATGSELAYIYFFPLKGAN